MGVQVFTNGMVLVNAVDLSNRDQEAALTYSAKTQDGTVMGMDTPSNYPVSKDWKLSLTLLYDESAASVIQTLFPLVGSATPVPVEIRPTPSARSATNPGYNAKGCITDMDVINGKWGDLLKVKINIVPFDIPGATGNTLLRSVA